MILINNNRLMYFIHVGTPCFHSCDIKSNVVEYVKVFQGNLCIGIQSPNIVIQFLYSCSFFVFFRFSFHAIPVFKTEKGRRRNKHESGIYKFLLLFPTYVSGTLVSVLPQLFPFPVILLFSFFQFMQFIHSCMQLYSPHILLISENTCT